MRHESVFIKMRAVAEKVDATPVRHGTGTGNPAQGRAVREEQKRETVDTLVSPGHAGCESPSALKFSFREIFLSGLRGRVIIETGDRRGVSEIDLERRLRMLWGGEL